MGWFDFGEVAVSRYIANSRHTKKLLEQSNIPKDMVIVNGRFVPGLSSTTTVTKCINDTIRIVYGGRICPEKGIDNIVKIIGMLRESLRGVQVKMDIYGNAQNGSSFFEEVRMLTTQLKLDDVIKFFPKIPAGQFLEKLEEYHVFLFPFRWEEPFGQVVIQAQTLGVAVVASNLGGVRELIDDGRDGFLLESGDLDGFAERIARLALDQDLFKVITDNARERVRQNFSVEACMNRLEEVIAQYAGNN